VVQLRTGHSWLGMFRKKIRKTEDDRCECRARKIIVHVLIDCPNLRQARQSYAKGSKIGLILSRSCSLVVSVKEWLVEE